MSSILINLILSIIVIASGSIERGANFALVMGSITGFFIALSVIGVALMSTQNFKLGSILAIIGFAVFIPIGMIGVIGVRKIGDARIREQAGVN